MKDLLPCPYCDSSCVSVFESGGTRFEHGPAYGVQVIHEKGCELAGFSLRGWEESKEAAGDRWNKFVMILRSSGNRCDTCGGTPSTPRIDKGLPAGKHCDRCWDKMLSECRSRSY